MNMDTREIFRRQGEYFNSNVTRDTEFRIEELRKLRTVLKDHEQAFYAAIHEDYGKSAFDTYVLEFSIVFAEIRLAIRKLRRWSRYRRVPSGLANFPARSYIIPEPLGRTLVIGAWNYPYQLSLLPAVSAIAAGNTVIIKPSELPTRTSAALAAVINDHFDPGFLHVKEGGVEETTELLELPFDKIFFTGSTPVGRIVYQAAAKNLTPVVLELGGKSPCIVLKDSKLNIAARRIVWAKFVNAGQTCVAPDYILVEREIEEAFLEALKQEIQWAYRDTDLDGKGSGENYLSIINERNYDRLMTLLDPQHVKPGQLVCGGKGDRDTRIIAPTVVRDVGWDDELMKDEIFGPILPVLTMDSLDEAIARIRSRPKPLSCYIYSRDRRRIARVLHEVSFGGGGVNESVMHLSVDKLPFGGVGHSGTGSYHGRYGFETFSHLKSIIDKPGWFEAPIKYAPYTGWKKKVISWLMERF